MSAQDRLSRRAIAAATIGNGLEFYDFITFAFFSLQIGQAFFPKGSDFMSLMGALATFGAGFVTRPLGAFVLGGFGDRVGRKPAMLLSFALMGSAIVVLALTPGYDSIGIAAPVIAILARLTQGFALGGEVGSATAYLLEMAPAHRRGFAASWQGASQAIAATIGASVGLVLTSTLPHDIAQTYAWRIALLIGALTVPFGIWVRKHIPETLHLDEEHTPAPYAGDLAPYIKLIVLAVMINGSGTIATYIFNYMATLGQTTLHLSASVSFAAEVVNNAVTVAAVLIGGSLSDRHGRKPLMIGSMLTFAVAILPMFLWLTTQRDTVSFLGANFVLAMTSGLAWGAYYAGLVESLPKRIRTRTFALVYSCSVALFGGSTQPIVAWLIHITGSAMAPAWYLTAATLIGLVAAILFPESAPARRTSQSMAETAVATA
jgi:MFS family permease